MKMLLQELRRRRVFRLAALYIVGAWVVIQIADVFFPAWGIPEVAKQYLFYAAALCFPVALVFGWFYDVTSTGIVRTPKSDDSAEIDLSLKRSDYVILIALVAVSATVIAGSFERISRVTPDTLPVAAAEDRPPNSLAVLPFENLSGAAHETRVVLDPASRLVLPQV